MNQANVNSRTTPKTRFTLFGLLRFVLYCAFLALCARLYWRATDLNQGLRALRNEDRADVGELILAKLGAKAVPSLIKELDAGDESAQLHAIAALGKIGPAAAPAVPSLSKKLDHSNKEIRRTAAISLGRVGCDSAAIAALGRALDDEDETLCIDLLHVLGLCAWTDPQAVSLVAGSLKDSRPAVRRVAANVLANCRAAASPAAEELAAALDDDLPGVQGEATVALNNIGFKDPKLIPALMSIVEKPDQFHRGSYAAAELLGKYGPTASDALPSLRNALVGSNDFLRLKAAEAVWNISGEVDEALPVLTSALKSEHRYYRQLAAEILGTIGSKASSAAPMLEEATKDTNLEVAKAAKSALESIASESDDSR